MLIRAYVDYEVFGVFWLDSDQRTGMAKVVVPPTHTGGDARTAIDRKCNHAQLVQLSIAALFVQIRACVDKAFGVFCLETDQRTGSASAPHCDQSIPTW